MKAEIKKSFRKGAAFAAGVGVFATLSFIVAQSINTFTSGTFTSGEVVSASKINANFQIAAPEGFIGAFYLTTCPDGWIAADGTNSTPDLRGRFVRGRDDAGTGAAGIDPGGVRAIGNEQTDAFQGHRHYRYPNQGMENNFVEIAGGNAIFNSGASYPQNAQFTGNPVEGGSGFGASRVANETRPRNVALIYCMRKDS